MSLNPTPKVLLAGRWVRRDQEGALLGAQWSWAVNRLTLGRPAAQRPSNPTLPPPHWDDTMLAMTTLVLVHGGLWEDGMDAKRFWATPGIVAGLQRRGLEVLAPNRPARAPSWAAEATLLAPGLPDRPVTLVAGSNGCSVAVRLALLRPDRIQRLLLAWPPSAGDPVVDARVRGDLVALGACSQVIDELLAGQTLRGVTDAELATLQMPVGALPSVPENWVHQRHTVDELLRRVPHTRELPGCPEPPHPEFPSHLERFLTAVTQFAAS